MNTDRINNTDEVNFWWTIYTRFLRLLKTEKAKKKNEDL